MQVSYHGENTELVSTHDVRLPKDSGVADVLEALRMQLPEDKRPAALRLLEVFYSKIYKVRPLLHAHMRMERPLGTNQQLQGRAPCKTQLVHLALVSLERSLPCTTMAALEQTGSQQVVCTHPYAIWSVMAAAGVCCG